jgi:hypothetical protein
MLLKGEMRVDELVFFTSATMTRNPAPKRGLVETSLPHMNVSQGNMFWLSERPIYSF